MKTASIPLRVVMIGGGYATLHAFRSLIGRSDAGAVAITVVSAGDCHNFHGFSGEVVAGLLPLEVTRTPLREVLQGAEFLHGQVTRVDLASKVVIAEPADGGAKRLLLYDELVVACGGREPVQQVPGMAEHGFTLRAPGEFERWLDRLDDIVIDGRPGTVVVAGGGMAGVELAAAVADRLRAERRDNPVVLAHSGEAVVPGLRAEHPTVAARVDAELARLGVRVVTGLAIMAVDADSAWLSDGSCIDAAAVLATTGQRPVTVPGLESLPHDSTGRLVTDARLAVAPGVWAAGDTARVAHPKTGKPVPANALWAMKAGDHLGRSLAMSIAGERPRRFRYRGLGQAMAFGVGRAATEMYGVPINGMLGWVLRLGFFLRFMPQRRRAIAVLRLLTSTARRRANLAKTDRPAATADGSFGVGANVEPAAA